MYVSKIYKKKTFKQRNHVSKCKEHTVKECLRRVTPLTVQTCILTQLACGAVAKSHALRRQVHLSRVSSTIATSATHQQHIRNTLATHKKHISNNLSRVSSTIADPMDIQKTVLVHIPP